MLIDCNELLGQSDVSAKQPTHKQKKRRRGGGVIPDSLAPAVGGLIISRTNPVMQLLVCLNPDSAARIHLHGRSGCERWEGWIITCSLPRDARPSRPPVVLCCYEAEMLRSGLERTVTEHEQRAPGLCGRAEK